MYNSKLFYKLTTVFVLMKKCLLKSKRWPRKTFLEGNYCNLIKTLLLSIKGCYTSLRHGINGWVHIQFRIYSGNIFSSDEGRTLICQVPQTLISGLVRAMHSRLDWNSHLKLIYRLCKTSTHTFSLNSFGSLIYSSQAHGTLLNVPWLSSLSINLPRRAIHHRT